MDSESCSTEISLLLSCHSWIAIRGACLGHVIVLSMSHYSAHAVKYNIGGRHCSDLYFIIPLDTPVT
jgi:hypothetical protein